MSSRPAWLWDQHACLPLQADADVGLLDRYARRDVGGFVSVNVGYSPHSKADSTTLLTAFRSAIDAHPKLELAETFQAVENAVARGQIAIAFDLEDSGPLDGDLDTVRHFAELGVRTMLPTYNHANAAGYGCLDADDRGLTAWGRTLVREMNNAGMVVDGSHCSRKTGLNLCDISDSPVIYSHSCLRSVWEHPRNISDDQARACAATGGVIGITGVGIFLGPNTPTIEAMIRHLEAAIDLVGVQHVGVSTDYSFHYQDFLDELTANPELFDESYTKWGPIQWVAPELLLTLGPALSDRGWPDESITAVLGGNFARVAKQVWPKDAAGPMNSDGRPESR